MRREQARYPELSCCNPRKKTRFSCMRRHNIGLNIAQFGSKLKKGNEIVNGMESLPQHWNDMEVKISLPQLVAIKPVWRAY